MRVQQAAGHALEGPRRQLGGAELREAVALGQQVRALLLLLDLHLAQPCVYRTQTCISEL